MGTDAAISRYSLSLWVHSQSMGCTGRFPRRFAPRNDTVFGKFCFCVWKPYLKTWILFTKSSFILFTPVL